MTIYWALSHLHGEDTSLWHSGLPACQVSLVLCVNVKVYVCICVYVCVYSCVYGFVCNCLQIRYFSFCLYIYVHAIMRTWIVGFAKWVVETDQ